MSDGILTQGKLFPLRDISSHEISNRYALDGTGLNGLFVAYVTGNQNPDNADGYSNQSVGSPYTNTFSTRYFNNRRVRATRVGDTKYQVAGVTLNTVAEYDENGNKLVNMPYYMREERTFILTGQTVPIVKRGFITISNTQVGGAVPIPGYPFVATGEGKIAVLEPVAATGAVWQPYILGRIASTTGSFNGGYTELEVTL